MNDLMMDTAQLTQFFERTALGAKNARKTSRFSPVRYTEAEFAERTRRMDAHLQALGVRGRSRGEAGLETATVTWSSMAEPLMGAVRATLNSDGAARPRLHVDPPATPWSSATRARDGMDVHPPRRKIRRSSS